MLRNLRTVRPIFPKIAPKVAQDFKEKKVMKACGAGKKFREIIARNVEGGRIPPPPPPPHPLVLLGLKLLILSNQT